MKHSHLTDIFAMSRAIEKVAKQMMTDENAASEFVDSVTTMSTNPVRLPYAEVYEGKDAAAKYMQWVIENHPTLTDKQKVAVLHHDTHRKFKKADTDFLDAEMIQTVFQTVDSLFPYTDKLFSQYPLTILLIDTQTPFVNAESTATFHSDGMQSIIRSYRIRKSSQGATAPLALLHELGHLLHMRDTGTITELPKSFLPYLAEYGIPYEHHSQNKLLELFADTFLLTVLAKTKQFGDPFPTLSENTKRICFTYIDWFIKNIE